MVSASYDKAPALSLRIRASGGAVLLFEPNVLGPVDDPDMITPDPLAFLSHCVDRGFYPVGAAAGAVELEIIDSRLDRNLAEQTWSVKLVNLDPAILKVLSNLLAARRPLSFDLHRMDASGAEAEVRIGAAFPGLRGPVPFTLERFEPDRLDRDRTVSITLARAPGEDEYRALEGMLDDWVNLLLLGAYPSDDLQPWESGVIPDLAGLTQSRVVEQTFSEAFLCHEAGFIPMLEGLRTLHRSGLPITVVEIR
jgi:hypothetical protein